MDNFVLKFNNLIEGGMRDRNIIIRDAVLNAVSANKNIEETEMYTAFGVNASSMYYSLPEDAGPRIIASFFTATSTYLSKAKVADTEQATVLILTDTSGIFKFAGIVEFHDNANDPNEPGNWSYAFTFNSADVENLEKNKKVKKLMYTDDAFKSIFDKVSYDVAGFMFGHERYMYDACTLVIDTLIQVLEAEAVEGQTVDIVYEGYFEASVGVEDDEKILTITPDGSMKEIIKSDIDLDK